MIIEGLALATLVGLGAYLLMARRKALVLYTAEGDGVAEFERNATASARALRTTAIPIRNGQDVVSAIQQAPPNIFAVVMIGHGTGRAFFRPGTAGLRIDSDQLPTWLGDDSFARLLVSKLTRPFVISLAGCRAGATSDEPDWTSDAYWTGTTTGPGGAGSLAGEIRDALARAGASDGEVRAHTTTGGVLANPAGRVFAVDRRYIGRPGAALIDVVLGPGTSNSAEAVRRWNTRIRGEPALRWMLGGRPPTRSEAA